MGNRLFVEVYFSMFQLVNIEKTATQLEYNMLFFFFFYRLRECSLDNHFKSSCLKKKKRKKEIAKT